MNNYLSRPLSVTQSSRMLKFLIVICDLKLTAEETLNDAARSIEANTTFSWEPPPLSYLFKDDL